MPREEDDDDLFHGVDDVEFDEDADEEKPKKKTAKKKTAKKKTAKKKTAAPKKKAKKKAKPAVEEVDDDDAEDTPKPKRKKAKKKAAPKKKSAKKKKTEDGFAAGLFDDAVDADPIEQPEEPAAQPPAVAEEVAEVPDAAEAKPAEEEPTDEYGRPEPVANYVVHVYEFGRLKRTIDRDFTPEAAEAYATEFSRTSKRYGRQGLAGKKDTQPPKELEQLDLTNRG